MFIINPTDPSNTIPEPTMWVSLIYIGIVILYAWWSDRKKKNK